MKKENYIFLFLLFLSPLFSEENILKKNIHKILDVSHDKISNEVSKRAIWFDSFFGKENHHNVNQSQLRLAFGPEWSTKESFGLGFRLSGKMDLPNFKRKFKIIVLSDDEENFNQRMSGSNGDFDRVSLQKESRNVVSSALRWSVDFSKKHHIDIDAGVKFRLPVSPFLRAYYEKYFVLNDDWTMTFSETLFAVLNNESGETTRFQFDRRLGKKLSLRFSNWATWSDESQGVDLHQDCSLYQKISKKSAIVYAVGWKSATEPSLRSEYYGGQIRFRQNFFKPWLFFLFEPGVGFDRANDWESEVSVKMNLQAFFGKK